MMRNRSIISILLVVLMAVNLSACTVSQTTFDSAANDNYREVADFSQRLVVNLGSVFDVWRTDINSLPSEFRQASVDMVKSFVDGDKRTKLKSEIVEWIISSADAASLIGFNFTVFSKPESKNLNANVIAQLITTMRYMTAVQKNLFYDYLGAADDESFYNSLKVAGKEAEKEYLDNTITITNTLISSGISEAHEAHPEINLSNVRIAMITEFGRAVSAKESDNHLINRDNNNITANVFNEIATTEMLSVIYPEFDVVTIADKISKVKLGITTFLNKLEGTDKDVVLKCLDDIQYRGLVSSGSVTPPTNTNPTPPTPTPTIKPSATPTATPTTTPTSTPTGTPEPTSNPNSEPESVVVISNSEYSNVIKRVNSGAKAAAFEIPNEEGKNSLEITLDKAQIKNIINGGASSMSINSDLFYIAFDKVALENDLLIDSSDGDGKIVITGRTFKSSDIKNFSHDSIGNRPVFNIKVTSSGKDVTQLKGYAVVSWRYNKAASENLNTLVAITDKPDYPINVFSVYNEKNQTLDFITKTFGTHAYVNQQINFSDIGMWAEDYINYLSARNIIVGVGDNMFAPEENITRAQFVTMLARISGISSTATGNSQFTDVPENEWFAGSIEWAASNGIAKGVEANIFEPNANITREQMSTMIKRYIDKATDYELSAKSEKIAFNDNSDISDWAIDSVYSMQQAELIQGKSNNIFDPQGLLTRAEASTVLSKLIQNETLYYKTNAPFKMDMAVIN